MEVSDYSISNNIDRDIDVHNIDDDDNINDDDKINDNDEINDDDEVIGEDIMWIFYSFHFIYIIKNFYNSFKNYCYKILIVRGCLFIDSM